MNAKNELINVQELKPGMVITKDVVKNGNLLIKEKSIVNEEMITRLNKAYFLEKIQVNIPEEVIAQSTKEAEMKKVEETFKEISVELKDMFVKLSRIKENRVNDLRTFSEKIQKELKSTEIVVSNVVFKGSGTDSIYRHGVNVAALSSLLGQWIGLDKAQLNLLVYSAILHDFGKTKIDRDVLTKDSTLTKGEFNMIKKHTNVGYNFIKDIAFLDKSVSYGVLMHHERLDGSGYPLGLTADQIHPFAKIIAIADVFDAINSDRGYKHKKLPFEALQIVKNESLGRLDYEYVKVFLEHIVNYYTGEEVILNTNEKCKIIQMNVNNLEKPLILKGNDFVDLVKENDLYIKEMLL